MGSVDVDSKKQHIEDVDRISNLPENVTDAILDLLPLQDAVRTSALSPNWRYKWKSISKLNFDESFNLYLSNRAKNSGPGGRTYDFSHVVNHVLRQHDHSTLLMVSFYISSSIRDYNQPKNWEHFISSKPTIKEIIFHHCNFFVKFFYELDNQFYSCVQLTRLKLVACYFAPPATFSGFPNLISLELECVEFREDPFVDSLSAFPSLERLVLDMCRGIERLVICSPRLKHLSVSSVIKSLHISAENLESLSVYFFPGSPPLSVTDCGVSSVDKIKKLSVGRFILNEMDFPGSSGPKPLESPLNFLKDLSFSAFDFQNTSEVLSALWLIRSAPDLQYVSFKVNQEPFLTKPLSCLSGQELKLSSLQVLQLSFCRGSRYEMDMLKFLVTSSPSLRTVSVTFDRPVEVKISSNMLKKMSWFLKRHSKQTMRIPIKMKTDV